MTLKYLEQIDMENYHRYINKNYNSSIFNECVCEQRNKQQGEFWDFLKFTENGFEHKIPDLAFPYICVYWLNKDKFEDSSIIYDENIKRSKINMHGLISLATLHV